MSNLLTLGTDPEFMLYGKTEKRVVSALRILGRNKEKPLSLRNGLKMYADNALCEASMPPESSVSAMIMRLKDTFTQMHNQLRCNYGYYSLQATASEFFTDEEMRDEKLWEVGCNPNWDAYREAENAPIPFTDTMRTGSFHIHLGNEKIAGKLRENPNKGLMIKVLDIYLGCASVIFDRDETGPARRRYYGKAGEFRSTEYGVEYRVLGNWSLRSPITTRLCFELAEHSLGVLLSGHGQAVSEAIGIVDPQKAINENNKELATDIIKRAAMPEEFMEKIFRKYRNHSLQQAWGVE